MNRDSVLKALTAHIGEIKEDFHVKSLSLFGSVVRNEGSDSSDVDLLVEFDRPIGLFHLVKTQQRLEKILGVERVDLVMRRAVIPELKERIYAEAVDVV